MPRARARRRVVVAENLLVSLATADWGLEHLVDLRGVREMKRFAAWQIFKKRDLDLTGANLAAKSFGTTLLFSAAVQNFLLFYYFLFIGFFT